MSVRMRIEGPVRYQVTGDGRCFGNIQGVTVNFDGEGPYTTLSSSLLLAEVPNLVPEDRIAGFTAVDTYPGLESELGEYRHLSALAIVTRSSNNGRMIEMKAVCLKHAQELLMLLLDGKIVPYRSYEFDRPNRNIPPAPRRRRLCAIPYLR